MPPYAVLVSYFDIDEGFRLTYGGYDYLALHTFALRGSVEGVGRQIGVGKEADVYLVTGHYPRTEHEEEETNKDDNGHLVADQPHDEHHSPALNWKNSDDDQDEDGYLQNFVLKIERLGRTSFRTVKKNRDYIGRRKHMSWMYLSRLAAEKEWSFLRALHSHGFPTPRPVDWNRHCIVMEWVQGRPLEQLHPEDWPHDASLVEIAQYLFDLLMRIILSLAEHGLVHGDFNEFNLLIKESFIANPQLTPIEDIRQGPVVMIDFPQMVSTAHVNAAEFFARDVNCLCLFFKRRFNFFPDDWPVFERDVNIVDGLAKDLKASGFKTNRHHSSDDDDEEEEESESDGTEGSETSESENENDVVLSETEASHQSNDDSHINDR